MEAFVKQKVGQVVSWQTLRFIYNKLCFLNQSTRVICHGQNNIFYILFIGKLQCRKSITDDFIFVMACQVLNINYFYC